MSPFFLLFIGDAPASPTVPQKDGDPDYWKLPWLNVEGESFADTLREKTIEHLGLVTEIPADVKPVHAKQVARKAVKSIRAYAKAAGSLLSDDAARELSATAARLSRAAANWKQAESAAEFAKARSLLAVHALKAHEARKRAEQDEEDALIAVLMAL